MAAANYTAEEWARSFDKCLVRKAHRDGGTYETHMRDCVSEFFSECFYGFAGKEVELRFKFQDKAFSFKAFVYDDFKVMDTTSNEVLGLYDNVHALKSMLKDGRIFRSLQKWATACYNAVGGNIRSMPLARRLFADNGQCYEDLIQAAKDAREASGEEVSELSASDSDE